MRINSISQSYTNRNKNQNFKANLYLANNFVPYIQQQGANIENVMGKGIGQKWLNEVWMHLQRLGKDVKGILYEDTPLVMAAKDDAFNMVKNTPNVYGEKDAYMCMDGKMCFVPSVYIPKIEFYTKPVDIKLTPDGRFVDDLLAHFSQIPMDVAKFMKPY